MKTFLSILFYLWQLPQNLLGLLLRAFYKADNKVAYKDKTVRVCGKFNGGISLGDTIIVNKYPNNQKSWNTVKHEYGHSIQSKYLGWFYIFIIGIPSLIWAWIYKPSMGSYYEPYMEKWADKLGNVKR